MIPKPETVDLIGEELAIRWSDGGESFLTLKSLRDACPCALCRGERGITGPIVLPIPRASSSEANQLNAFEIVGAYGLRTVWRDGHSSGIYPFALLRELGSRQESTTAE